MRSPPGRAAPTIRRPAKSPSKGNSSYQGNLLRNDPDLVAVVTELGDTASGDDAQLVIQQMHISITIENHDGYEHRGCTGRHVA